MKGLIILVFVAVVGISVGGYWFFGYDRVDPGNAGVLLDYCEGTQQTITDSKYIWVGYRCNRLAEYPTAEFTLDQINAAPAGSPPGAPGDNSIRCVMKDQQVMHIEAATAWAVDPTKVADLYRMRPGVPLTGSAGTDISSLVVTSEVRAGVREACTQFGWEEAYGAKRSDFEAAAEKAVQARLEAVVIKVRTVSIRNIDPSPELDSLIAARLEGQKVVEASMFVARQAENQGAAQLAQQKAAAALSQQQASDAALLAKIQQEAATAKATNDATAAEIAAESAKKVAKAKTDSDAADIEAKGTAQAKANQLLAASITPQMVEYERWKKWNGQLAPPANIVNTTGVVSVPAAAPPAP